MRVKLTECPNFTWYLPKNYFSWFYLKGDAPFPTPRPPLYFLSSTNVVQITRKFCACDCSGIRAVAGIFWNEFRTLLDEVTLSISWHTATHWSLPKTAQRGLWKEGLARAVRPAGSIVKNIISHDIHRAETTLRISGSYRNCFHGALKFNELFRHTRSTVVDEISEAILRRFEVDAKSPFTHTLRCAVRVKTFFCFY